MIENLHTAASTWEQNIKFQIKFQILKIIKKTTENVTNMIKQVVKVEKRKCTTLSGRSKRIGIKHVLFRDMDC